MPLTQVQGGMLAGSTNTTTTIQSNGVTAMTIDSSQNVGIGTSSPTTRLNVVNTSYSGSSSPYGIVSSVIGGTTLDNNWGHFVVSQASTTNGDGGKIIFGYGSTPGSDLNPIAAITASKQGDFFGNLLFFTRPSGGSNTERMRIDSSGNLLVGGTTNVGPGTGRIAITSPDMLNTVAGLGVKNNANNTGGSFAFWVNSSNSIIGTISQNSSTSVGYNTSSDYRLKDNVQPMTGALAKVAQLKPVTFTWNTDNTEGQGFIAHELQEVCPDAVNGTKDAVDADGNPVYQGVDTSFLVATLTAAIQELKAELDATKAEVAALKAAP